MANASNNSVTEINASDGSFVQNLSGGSYNFHLPAALAFDGRRIWVANGDLNNSSVTELNASDGSLAQNLSAAQYGFSSPSALAFIAPQPIRPIGLLWVVNNATYSVTEVSTGGTRDGSLVRLVGAGTGTVVPPYNFDVPGATTRDQVWVANMRGNSVTEFNTADGSWVRTARTPG